MIEAKPFRVERAIKAPREEVRPFSVTVSADGVDGVARRIFACDPVMTTHGGG